LIRTWQNYVDFCIGLNWLMGSFLYSFLRFLALDTTNVLKLLLGRDERNDGGNRNGTTFRQTL
jgi:hypothetical protein